MEAIKSVVVIGASSGGIEALKTIAAALPPDFPAPIAVVVHTSPQAPGVLDEILSRSGPLKAVNASSGRRLIRSRIYVAPPDCHLIPRAGQAPGHQGTARKPLPTRYRSPLPLGRAGVRSRCIGVVLTGSLDDGTAGLWTIKQLGGATIVQDPNDALYPGMPQSAIHHVEVDHVVPLSGVALLLTRLTRLPIERRPTMSVPERVEIEVNISKEQNSLDVGVQRLGELRPLPVPSATACCCA